MASRRPKYKMRNYNDNENVSIFTESENYEDMEYLCGSYEEEQPINKSNLSITSQVETEATSDSTPGEKAMLMVILENQAKQGVQIEALLKRTDEIHAMMSRSSIPKLNDAGDELTFKPIDSIEDLTEFEEQLRDKEFLEKMLTKFSSLIGKKSLSGHNVSYTLVDYIFTRKLFTLVSWAGGSKPGAPPKTCFQIYIRTISFFHKLVKIYDADYTDLDVQQFFKTKVIANSKRRQIMAPKRDSRTRARSIQPLVPEDPLEE